MRLSASMIAFVILGNSFTQALTIPSSLQELVRRSDELPIPIARAFAPELVPRSDLERRKGGGGGGKGGGSSGGSSSSSGGSSSGGKSGGSSSSSSSSSSGSRSGSSPSSNVGGSTRSGSGAPRAYGSYYSGGAATPYSAGRRSPLGIAPFLLPIAALSIFPGIWLYSAYAYPYSHPWNYRNYTDNAQQAVQNATQNFVNSTIPVLCLCQQYSVCGCDDNNNSTYINSILSNGTLQGLNNSVARVSNVNGTQTLVLNATLPNGTTAADGSSSSSSGASANIKLTKGMQNWSFGAVGLVVMMAIL